MTVQFANNAFSTLAAGINDSVTTLAVASGHGARFPTITGSQYFYATLIDSSNNLEIIKVTAKSGTSDTFSTIVRNQESSGAKTFSTGDRIELRLTALGLNDIAAEVYSDSEFRVQDNGDATKQLAFECSGITGGQTRVVTAQDSNLTMAGTNITQSFSKAQRGTLVTLSSSSNATAVDFSLGNNYTLTLGENSALTNPSNETAGQAGSILIIQDGTGSRTLSYGSHYLFAGGTDPTLSTAGSSVDRLDYFIQAADKVHCVLTKALE